MNTPLKRQAEQIRLSASEKAAMRGVLGVHMREHPLRIPARQPSYGSWMYFMRVAVPGFAVLLLLFTGTAYAAQGSLPGDLLYPVKIDVTEPVEVALATTPLQKAAVETRLATRRVAEAQTLAARGELTATTTQALQENFNAHATEALALTADAQPATASSTASMGTTTASTTPPAAPAADAVVLQISLRKQATIFEQLRLEESGASSTEATSTASSTIRVDFRKSSWNTAHTEKQAPSL